MIPSEGHFENTANFSRGYSITNGATSSVNMQGKTKIRKKNHISNLHKHKLRFHSGVPPTNLPPPMLPPNFLQMLPPQGRNPVS